MKRAIAKIVLFSLLFTSIATTNAFAHRKVQANVTHNNVAYNQETVSEAVYQADNSSIKAFDYALCSGNTITGLTINSSNTNVVGDVHTNNDFLYRGSRLKISGTCESSGIVDIKAPNADVSNIKENAEFIEMPYIVSDIKDMVFEDTEVFSQNKKYNGKHSKHR